MQNISVFVMNFDSLAALSAAISSSLGSVTWLSGTILAFAIMKDILPFTHKNAIAPYAMGLASAKCEACWAA